MSKLIALAQPFVLRPYTKKELRQLYNISPYILKLWMAAIPDMGEPIAGMFSIIQMQKFTERYGVPGQVIREAA